MAIRPDFSIIDIYFDKYRRQNDFKMQYSHSTILQCDPQVARHYQSTIEHDVSCADHVITGDVAVSIFDSSVNKRAMEWLSRFSSQKWPTLDRVITVR